MPNFLTPEAIMDSLGDSMRKTLVLTNYSSRIWLARVKDADASAILATHTKADANALSVHKYLFEGTRRHQALVGAIRASYNLHKEMSRPMGSASTGKSAFRVLSNTMVPDYLTALMAEDAKIQVAFDEFEKHYEDDKAVGIRHLGDLAQFSDQLYKPKEELHKLFSVQYDNPLPFPDKNAYGDLEPETLTRLQMNLEGELRARMSLTFDEAVKDFLASLDAVRSRLEDRLDNFNDPESKTRRLTSAVLSRPVVQAQTLRRFARGVWADRMVKIENALEKILYAKNLSQDPEMLQKATAAITALEARLKKA